MTTDNFDYALFITGNPGNGKSFICNQLGAKFVSGFSTQGGGVTTKLHKSEIFIGNDRVCILDAPGLIETEFPATQRNASYITEALRYTAGIGIPCKVGVIITDQNGRAQPADTLLIRKLSESLHPKIEIFIIVNQIKRRNLEHYKSTDILPNLVKLIRESTGAIVNNELVVPITECSEGDKVDLEQLKLVLSKLRAVKLERITNITISKSEIDSLGFINGQSQANNAGSPSIMVSGSPKDPNQKHKKGLKKGLKNLILGKKKDETLHQQKQEKKSKKVDKQNKMESNKKPLPSLPEREVQSKRQSQAIAQNSHENFQNNRVGLTQNLLHPHSEEGLNRAQDQEINPDFDQPGRHTQTGLTVGSDIMECSDVDRYVIEPSDQSGRDPQTELTVGSDVKECSDADQYDIEPSDQSGDIEPPAIGSDQCSSPPSPGISSGLDINQEIAIDQFKQDNKMESPPHQPSPGSIGSRDVNQDNDTLNPATITGIYTLNLTESVQTLK